MKIARFEHEGKVGYGILEEDTLFALEGELFGKFHRGPEIAPLREVQLLAPVQPSIVVCAGLNYMRHIQERGLSPPKEPLLFFKPSSSVIGHLEDIVYPALSQQTCYEGELCLIIKRPARGITEGEALDYILGYTCGNDLTARDIMEKDGNNTRAKSFDTFCALGPCIAIGLDGSNLAIQSRVNGRVQQDSSTKEMIFGIEKLVSYISQFMSLRPGDVIMTGTPSGGLCPIQVGDVLEVEIEGIGVLQNKVVAPK
ncbi:MAG TPA: fumarylacetoacetate hydrolase family protein [Dehalococcoidia bacterium]|jgi:2-keto-4-pentenoate hydratase/2-oxohepta-3-ene-1,7-dioic acid hydratase in catechol pathway|nr:fumarylacetoacetate hydrolase family protein [Dehalococcoidia bacterium]